MSLLETLAPNFSAAARRKGFDLCNQGMVRVLEASDGELRATLTLGRPIAVRIARVADGNLRTECVCPEARFAGCAHVWATLAHAESRKLPWDRSPGPSDDGEEGEIDRPSAGKLRDSIWKQRLSRLRGEPPRRGPVWPSGREIVYLIRADLTRSEGRGLWLQIYRRQAKRGGGWTALARCGVRPSLVAVLPDPADRRILASLLGAISDDSMYERSDFTVGTPLDRILAPLLGKTGRCFLKEHEEATPTILRWEAAPWQFWLEIREERGAHVVTGDWRRDTERRGLDEAVLVMRSGLVFFGDQAAPADYGGAFDWALDLSREGPLRLPADRTRQLLSQLTQRPEPPHADLSPLGVPAAFPRMTPRLAVRAAELSGRLECELSFGYGRDVVHADTPGWATVTGGVKSIVRRDRAAESAAITRLEDLNLRRVPHRPLAAFTLAARHLPRVVQALVSEGWRVEAEGSIYRPSGDVRVAVASGIDWFDLTAEVDFEGQRASLPELLAAIKRGEKRVRLGDGTFGILPEVWLDRFAPVAGLGQIEGDRVRFRPAQAALLDALLEAQPSVEVDETFARIRESLRQFEGIVPSDPPTSFTGRLRDYQREGLGWFAFLEGFGFGGCLADDMGLGKTVQVLAHLDGRRGRAERPSLVVAPRSLIFNWRKETERFTPGLRLLDHTGPDRARDAAAFDGHDVVLTTYGTLRRDVRLLSETRFDYVVLDEAQMIKNAGTDAAKAARLLKADHRLALSGTPVENHLGELWSLFEFLNPGMLGRASALDTAGSTADSRTFLARALRPFILRRTKEQVAKDLPPKVEQTLYCEMEPPQRRRYDELREHYRQSLLPRVEREGVGTSSLQILEALLRLRQASCHSGLLDPSRRDEPAAKLDVLLPRLREVLDEGHKSLVFSQFTSFLAIVQDRLTADGITHAYLDGKTRDREAVVQRFQEDPDCGVFLISLKAGGLGLNLTAAQYVFLLDPWWNPAVEAQAMDRAHRLGQTSQVFAYRLVAQDTIEEKILSLQENKRSLADAIVGADNSLIRNLGRDDLALLFS